MSKVNRDDPKRSTASEARFTLFEFDREFPDDTACLDYLMARMYPDGVPCGSKMCGGRITKHYRVNGQPSYKCEFCGTNLHPMARTIFKDSATSLRLWFYAMYLMASTRCGISAKQLERELGVTYKTAWRMFNRIRSLLPQDDVTLGGTVEMDEAYIGGKSVWKNRKQATGIGGGWSGKTPVFGIAQRAANGKSGRIVARVVPDTGAIPLMWHTEERVLPGSVVYTDEWQSYDGLRKRGYKHSRVPHAKHVYVQGEVHTNTIEGFWSLLKRGISGVYHGVSTKHLQAYVDEYVFRYNNRDATGRGMFDAFLDRAVTPQEAS